MSVGAVNKQTGDRIPTAGLLAIDAALSGSSTNPVQNRVVKAAFDAIDDGQSIDSFADVETALSEKADTDIVASDFSTAVSYTAGDYCIYEGKFYKFKTSHSGVWSASDVDEIKIAGELASLKSGLMSAAKAVYRDYHRIAAGGSYTFSPTLEVNHAYLVAISGGNNTAWGYCGIMLKGWVSYAAILSDIYKGTYITTTIVDADSIQVSNSESQYDGDVEIVVIDLGRGYQGS